MATLFERLAQAAYEAHCAALTGDAPAWEDLTENEQHAWRAAASAVAGQSGDTSSEAPSGRPLVVKVRRERHSFNADFTAGREGGLVIDDDFTSAHHARFQTVRGLWYVEDLGSTNGIRLNGHRILAAQLLHKRDKVTIGRTVVTVVSL
jgi:pSer/pThr/pTyr-binding forkhead associated (FHA) protein